LLALVTGGCSERRSAEKARDTLVVGFGDNFKTFDPAHQVYAQESAIIIQVLEPLARFDNNLRLVPCLATSWETPDNCSTWVFHLRRGVRFHDGTHFNAEAVQRHFARIKDPATASSRRERIKFLREVEVLDTHTVAFHLEAPDCVFPETLSGTFASIPSPAAIERWGEQFGLHPVGTGPFVFEDWTPDVSIRLKRNPDYWNSAGYHFGHLEFWPVRENTTRLILLEQGILDMADISFAHVNAAKKESDIVLQTIPSLSIRYIGFNTKKPPFSDPRVRQAANYAVNKADMIRYMFFGVGSPATGPLPPVLPAFNESLNPYKYDPEMARRLLAEAGYPNGFKCTLWTMETGVFRLVADAAVEYLRKVGIDVEMKIFDNAAYWDRFDEHLTPDGREFPTKEGVFDIYVAAWVGGEYAHGFLEPLFRSGSYSNSSFYSNPEVDRLLADYKREPSETGRIEIARQLQTIIVDDAPWIFAAHGQWNLGLRHRVQNYHINPSGMYFFDGVRLADEEVGVDHTRNEMPPAFVADKALFVSRQDSTGRTAP